MDISKIEDEELLQQMLDDIPTDNLEERKRVRTRLLQLKKDNRVKRDAKLSKLTDSTEERLRNKVKEADDQKRRTLAAYDHMAKSAPAGGQKTMDINVYKSLEETPTSSGASTPSSLGNPLGGKRDLVEEAIRARAKESEDQKKRMLAAFEFAAKSAPAGIQREVDFDSFKRADVSGYEPTKPMGTATMEVSSGITKVVKAPLSRPGTPASASSTASTCMSPLPGVPNAPFPKVYAPDAHIDSMERAIRGRQKELEEAKRKKLAAYDLMAKLGPGHRQYFVEEFRDLNVPADVQLGTDYKSCAAFQDGRAIVDSAPTPVSSARTSRQSSIGPRSLGATDL